MDELITPILKRFCEDCKREFTPARPETRLCFRCGGSPEALPPSQPRDVVRVYDLDWIKLSGAAFLLDGKQAVVNSIELYEHYTFDNAPNMISETYHLGLWELDGFTRLKTYNDPHWLMTDKVRVGLALSRDNRFALTGGIGSLPLYDLEKEERVRTFKLAVYDAEVVCITPDGAHAIAGDGNGVVWIWEITSGLCLRKLEGDPGKITQMVLLSSGDLITVTEKGDLRQWDLRSGECIAARLTRCKIQAAILTLDENLLFSSEEGKIMQWDPRASTAVAGVFRQSTLKEIYAGGAGCAAALALTKDGNAVLVGGKDGVLRLVELSSGDCLRAWQPSEPHRKPIGSLALSPEGRRALVGAGDELHLWEWAAQLAVGAQGDRERPADTMVADDIAERLLEKPTGWEPAHCRNCDLDLSRQANSDGRAAELKGLVSYLCPSCAAKEDRTGGLQVQDYRLLRNLGEAGIFRIYRAWHEPTCRVVRLDRVKADLPSSRFVEDMLLVKNALCGMKHPNLPQLVDACQEKGEHYYAWEDFGGAGANTLAERSGGKLPYHQAGEIALQALDGLGYLHSQGWVHRDIKPANLLVKKVGEVLQVRITCFDLMFNFIIGEPYAPVGAFAGTYPFMPREQILNFNAAEPAWDLYSLGASLYNLLTGKYVLDFSGWKDPIRCMLEGEPVPVAERNPSFLGWTDVRAVDRAVSKKKEERFQSAAQFKAHLLCGMQFRLETILVDSAIKTQCAVCGIELGGQASSDGNAASLADLVHYICPDCVAKESTLEDRLGDYVLLYALEEKNPRNFKAWHPRTCRVVNLEKVSPAAYRRLEQHRDQLDALKHLNLLRFIHCGEEHRVPYAIWDPFAGESSAALLESNGKMPASKAVEIALQALDGLGYLHDKGIVHRAITPANLLVKEEDNQYLVKIGGLDLVLPPADQRHDDSNGASTVEGCLPYMAREMMVAFNNAKPASDLYALGASLYFLLTGQYVLDFPPAAEKDPVCATLEAEPVPIRERDSSIPPVLALVVDKAVSKKAEDRYQSAAQFKAYLLAAEQSIRLSRTIKTNQMIRAECNACKTDLSEPASADGRGVELAGLVYHLCPDCTARQSTLEKRLGDYVLLNQGLVDIEGEQDVVLKKAWHPFTCRVVNLQAVHRWKKPFGGALRRLSHPNLMRLIEDYEVQGELIWVREAFDGVDVATLAEQNGGKLPFREATEIVLQASDGLTFLHSLGWVQRRLKPQNLMVKKVKEQRLVKITGLDWMLSPDPELRAIEEAEDIIFSFDPSTPYEMLGDFKHAKPVSDIYALGACLYNLLTGRFVLDFPADGQEYLIRAILEEEPVPMRERDPSIWPALAQVVDKAVSKKSEDRYQSAAQFKAHLLAATQSIRLTRTIMMEQVIKAECSVCKTDLGWAASADGRGVELVGLVYHLCPDCAAKQSRLEKRLGEYVLLDPVVADSADENDVVFHKAWHPFTCRVVNLELEQPELGLIKSFLYRRMSRISHALQQLSHPNLLHLMHEGEDEDTRYWVWEAFDGVDAASLAEQYGGKLPFWDAAEIVKQVLDGLSYLHGLGWIHNRLEPKNIIVKQAEYQTQVKVTGFDLMENPDKNVRSMDMTEDEMIEVNQVFRPLEQLSMINGTPVSDLYAMGACLYYLLTGQSVFNFTWKEHPIDKILEEGRVMKEEEPVPIRHRDPSIHEALAKVVDKAVSKKPEDRYQSAAEFKGALQAAQNIMLEDLLTPPEIQRLLGMEEEVEVLSAGGYARCCRCGKDLWEQANSDGRRWELRYHARYLCEECAEREHRTTKPPVGDYVLLAMMGSGFAGEVYKAWHQPTCRLVALKQPLKYFDRADEFRKLFLDSMQPLLSLRHPLLAHVYAAGETDGRSFIACEFMEDGNLWDLLQKEAPLPAARVMHWAIGLLNALTYLHRRGIMHGNLHARNILVSRRFGRQVQKICVADRRADYHGHIQRIHAMVDYDFPWPIQDYYHLSREALLSYKYTKPHADCYAVAAWMYYALCGNPPLEFSTQSDPMEVILKHAPIPLRQRAPDVHDGLAHIIDQALSSDKQVRFSSAASFLRAVREVQSHFSGLG